MWKVARLFLSDSFSVGVSGLCGLYEVVGYQGVAMRLLSVLCVVAMGLWVIARVFIYGCYCVMCGWQSVSL